MIIPQDKQVRYCKNNAITKKNISCMMYIVIQNKHLKTCSTTWNTTHSNGSKKDEVFFFCLALFLKNNCLHNVILVQLTYNVYVHIFNSFHKKQIVRLSHMYSGVTNIIFKLNASQVTHTAIFIFSGLKRNTVCAVKTDQSVWYFLVEKREKWYLIGKVHLIFKDNPNCIFHILLQYVSLLLLVSVCLRNKVPAWWSWFHFLNSRHYSERK